MSTSNARYSDMTIAELRGVAKALGIDINKSWTKDEYLKAIGQRRKSKVVARLVEETSSPIPEGYARIKIQRGQGYNGPIDVVVNGFKCIIPRDVIVDVPIEVVNESLNHSEDHEYRIEKTTDGEEVTRKYARQTYQYQMFGMNDTGISVIKGINAPETQSLREKYRDIFGQWPNREDFKQFSANWKKLQWEKIKGEEEMDEVETVIMSPKKKAKEE